MYKIPLILIILLSNTVQASEINGCAFLSIAVNNMTPWACTLTQKLVKAGKLSGSTQVPTFLPANSQGMPFEMQQLFYGPDLTLTYQCGENHQITFRSQQDLCVLSSGNMVSEILAATMMTAHSIKEPGSYFWSQHGIINWTLEAT